MPSKIAQIVPLRRLPRTKGVFDYIIPDNFTLIAGDLVQITFKNSLVEGLVLSVGASKFAPKKLKVINKILISGFVNNQQLKLITWLADYSGVSLASVAKLTVPFNLAALFVPVSTKKAIKQQHRVIKPINIIYSDQSQKDKVVSSLVGQVLKRQQQVLILVPELSNLNSWYSLFKDKGAVIYSGSEKISSSRLVWQNIRSGQAKIIVGTRAALWLNYINLGGIIVDQADNENYFQSEQNPRYDTLIVAKYLAKLCVASFAQVTPAPRLENWQAAQAGEEQWQELATLPIKLQIIDLKLSSRIFKSGLISTELKTAVDKALANDKKVLLYLNRRGGATSSMCEDCGLVAICPKCQRALVQSNSQTELICFHCGDKQKLALPCPRCGGWRVNYTGGGLTKLTREANQIWPEQKIIVLEDKFELSQISLAKQVNIILGSRTAIRAVANLTLGVSALVRADAELFMPEFRSVERLWQLTRYLAIQSEELFIQTNDPQHYLWSSLKSKSLDSFYRSEILLRKKYSYPPLVKLIRFTFENKNENQAQHQAGLLGNILKKQLPAGADIVGPYPDYYRMRANKWSWHILVKHNLNYEQAILWPSLPEDVIIDRNPWFILS